MPILNRAAELQDEVAGWRRELHRMPELNFDLFRTSAFVADKLREFGCDEIVTGMAKTGIVAVIRGRNGPAPTIGLRAATTVNTDIAVAMTATRPCCPARRNTSPRRATSPAPWR